ncbi:MAG TPA: MFS transporter, partial [Saprospiraceae bacterium]|nr:MFS transporter [Saprospiraceae bacterium]
MLNHVWSLLRQPVARAIGISFFINGFVFGSWTSCIPYLKGKFELDEAELGLLLLSMPAGVLVMNPLTVYALKQVGMVRSTLVFGGLMGLAFALAISMPWLPLVSAGLFLAGCVFACHNVAMNTYASNLEANHGMRLMAACHGMWSLGAMTGALLSSLSFGILKKMDLHFASPQSLYFWSAALLLVGLVWWIEEDLNRVTDPIHDDSKQVKSPLSMFKPNATLLLLASVLICTYFTEGSMADWTAVYMQDMIRAPQNMIGWGYATFAACMAGGRFVGDELIHRYTGMVVLRAGGVLVFFGFLWIIFISNPWLVLPGFMLIGLGVSLASPILYGASARVPNLPPGAGLATMNSFGMVAFLGGPVVIGFLA